MSVHNINTLQELANTNPGSLQTLSDVYLKQSLANLGQRFSIKGDGIASGQFYLYELFKTLPEPTEEDFAYGGKLYSAYFLAQVKPLEDESLEVSLSAYNIDDQQGVVKTIILNNEDTITFNEDFYLAGAKPSSANNSSVAYFGESGIITKDSELWNLCACSYDANSDYVETVVESFTTDYPYIQSGLKIFTVDGITHLAEIRHIKIEHQTDHYVLTTYTSAYNPEYLTDILLNNETGYCKKNKGWEAKDVTYALTEFITTQDARYSYVTYDEQTQYLYLDTNDNIATNALKSFNDDMAITRKDVISIFNEETYFADNSNLSLKSKIVAELFVKLYDNYIRESDGDNVRTSTFRAWLPYDYLFNYYCNSNDAAQILSSSRGITVEMTPNAEANLWKIYECGTERVREQLIIAQSYDITDSTEDIFTVWEYHVSYNEEGYIECIVVNKMYSLPYINDDGYWNVYGVDTDIYARGKDGGQPSIIITYTDTYTGTRQVLSTLNRDELSYFVSWEEKNYRVRPLDASINVGQASYHMMSTYMPVPPSYLVENYDNMMTFLKSAIIMNVNSVKSEQFDESTTELPLYDENQLGPDSVVTTFWAFERNPITKEYEFTYVKEPGTTWAVDFNYLTNAEAIVKYYMAMGLEPDRYHFSWLVYDGVTGTLKNQAQPASKARAYPVLMNRRVAEVSDILFTEGDLSEIYRNNANFVPAFQTQVNHKNSYITGVEVSNPEKFFYLDTLGYLPSGDSYTYVDSYTGETIIIKPDNVATAIGLDQKPVDEWYPNTTLSNIDNYLSSLLPIMDFKEMFIRNANVLNRYNILSTDANGQMWYSYLGTSYEDANKSVLHFGTGTTDINIGIQTMTNDEIRSRFQRTPKVDVDFDTITMNGDTLFTKGWWEVINNGQMKTYSRKMELSYIGEPPVLEDLSYAYSYTFFTVPCVLSPSVSNIGNNTSVSENSSYISYVNITKLIEEFVFIPSFSYETPIYGDLNALYNVECEDGSYAYIMKLASDINDDAQKVSEDVRIAGTIQMSYQLEGDLLSGDPTVNVKEIYTSSASSFVQYYGGEL